MRGKVIAIVSINLVLPVLVWAGGTETEQTFYSEALGENRTIQVYLPDGYQTSGIRYPVVYFFLHDVWNGTSSFSFHLNDFGPALDDMIADGIIDPLIIVEPNASTTAPPQEWRVQGFNDEWMYHFHSNSELLGHHEDFLVDDLVDWVDWRYRTVGERTSRFIVGSSIGGHGAIRMALRHPDVFGGASIDNGFMAILEGYMMSKMTYIVALTAGPPYDFSPLNDSFSEDAFEFCAAFTPNLSQPPWYVDFILNDDGEIDQGVYQRLLAESPPQLVADYKGSEYALDLFFRVDEGMSLSQAFWPVVEALAGEGIPHVLRVCDTDDDPLMKRLEVNLTYLMPIKATAEISPRVADPRLYPRRLRVALELPGDLDVADIDCSTLALIDIDGNRLDCPVGCSAACEVSDVNGNGRDDLSVWLSSDRMARAAVAAGAKAGDEIRLTIRGELEDGRFFQATDTVTLANELDAVAAVD